MVCLTITLVFTTALAQEEQEPVFVFPYFDDYVEVSPGQEVVLWTGWLTCTRGQAVSFLNSVHLEWKLDGEPLFSSDEEVAELWFPIRPWDGPPGCISAHGRQSWFNFWGYSLYFNEAGTHKVNYELWVDHPVTDGYDLEPEDGRPDIYRGSQGTASTIIEVVAP